MGLRRQTHKGKARKVVRGKSTGRPPAFTDGVPFISLQNFPLIRKQLLHGVKSCEHRKNTGKVTTAPCCRAEQGRVYRCELYGHTPAKLYDCLNCIRQTAIERNEPWIRPLLQLSRGSEVRQSLQEVRSAIGQSESPPTSAEKPLPGHLDGD